MRKLYLIRHGQPDGGSHRCIGRTDLPLDDIGVYQARRLALWASDKGLTAVYTSPLIRCLDTANILSAGRFPVLAENDLREMDGGLWDGLSFSDIRARWPEEYAARGVHIGTCSPPEGESFAQAGNRLGQCLDRLFASTGGDIAVVTHAGAARGWLCSLLSADPDAVLSIPQPWGGITELTCHNGRWSILTIGRQPDLFPPSTLLHNILDKYDVPAPVRAHCEAVARAARTLAEQIDPALVDLPLLDAACRLHDVARGHDDHPRLGAKWLTDAGYPAVAELIACHHDLPPDARVEAQLLYLADKLVRGATPVTLEDRFDRSRKKCRDEAALTAWRRRYDAAKDIMERFHLKWSAEE